MAPRVTLFAILKGTIWLSIGLALFAALPARADMKEAEKAYQAKDYEKAWELFLPHGNDGNAQAQFRLGLMKDYGRGTEKDQKMAAKWYEKASRQGHSTAQYNLGIMYGLGKGVSKNLVKAVYWYEKAAKQGYAWAQFNLAKSYDNGHGVEKDIAKAAFWYGKAAEQAHAGGQFNLGQMYFTGDGVKQNRAKGISLLNKSARQGNPHAMGLLGVYHFERKIPGATDVTAWMYFELGRRFDNARAAFMRERVGARMSAGEIAEASARAGAWLADTGLKPPRE